MMRDYQVDMSEQNSRFLIENHKTRLDEFEAHINKIANVLGTVEDEKIRESALKTLKSIGDSLESVYTSMVSYEMAMNDMEHPRVVFSNRAVANRALLLK